MHGRGWSLSKSTLRLAASLGLKAHRRPLLNAANVHGSRAGAPRLAGVYGGSGRRVRDDRQRGGGRVGHGGLGVEETIGGQHHGLNFELCGDENRITHFW